LPPRWRGWAIQLMRYGVRFIDIGRMGHSDKATRASPKYRDGDEEDRASGGEILTSAPALSERCHRSLAGRLIAVRGALDVPTVPARPHPRTSLRRSSLQMEDAANDLAVFEHVVVVVAPTRWVAALEDQRRHGGFNDAARRLTQR
jgi:hypothetical protein